MTGEAGWRSFYRVAGVAALVIILAAITDIVMSFLPGGASAVPGSLSAAGWFALFRENWFMGLRNLGLFNMINTTLMVPVFLALYGVHRRPNEAFAALALLVVTAGAAVYIANNAAFPMLALSGRYGTAATEQERSMLAAAGEAVLASSEDLTAGTFMGFFLTELAGIIMALVVLRGKVFGAGTAMAGLVAYGFLLVFNILVAFVPGSFGLSLLFAAAGGLSAIAWYSMVARKLVQLSSERSG